MPPLWQHIGSRDLLHDRALAAPDTEGLAGINDTLAAAALPPALPWPPGWRQRRRDGVRDP